MSGGLVPSPHGPSALSPSAARPLRRALTTVRSGALVQAERVAAVAYVADRAMTEIAFLAQKHIHLVGVVPLADGGLQMIRDTATLAMAQLVAEMGRL